MELDGYSEYKKIAFEYQGPQHYRFDKKYDLNYSSYYQRLINDKMKKDILKLRNIKFIILSVVIAIVACIISSIVPARKSLKLNPVEAIKS